MVDRLTHPLHLALAIVLLICAVAAYSLGLSVKTVSCLLAGVVFELGFWFTVFSSSKMIRGHEDHIH